MKRLLLTLSLAGVCVAALAQDHLSSLTAGLRNSCTEFDYTFKMAGDFPLTGSGAVTIQGDAFLMVGNGLEVVSDGTTRWTVDRAAAECYIESVDDSSVDIVSNPALVLGSLDRLFSRGAFAPSNYAGRKTSAVTLTPVSKSVGLASAVAHFLPDGNILALVLTTADGTAIDIELSSMQKKTPVPLSPTFVFDVSSLGKDYVITDLR